MESENHYTFKWRSVNLITALLLIMIISLISYLIGYDTLVILLKSQKKTRIILPIIISVILIIFNIIIGFSSLLKSIKDFRILISLKIFSLITLLAVITSSSIYTLKYLQYLNGKQPDIFSKFNFNAGPFIQFGPIEENRINSTSNSMLIWWFTKEKQDDTLQFKYGTSPDADTMAMVTEKDRGDGKKHQVVLNGLVPSTKYYYSIPGFNDTIYHFTTGPPTGESTLFRFMCMGDVRNHGADSYSYYGDINSRADMFYKDNNLTPSFKLVLGDIVNKGIDHESWNSYFNDEKLHSPYYPIINSFGNHEFAGDFGGNYRYFFDYPRHYSFDFSGAHFLIIHNYDGFLGTTGKTQYEFVKNDLKKNHNKKWIIVAIHEPPLSTGDYNMNELLIAQYFELFRKYKVDMVLTGHDHNYDSFHVDSDTPWGGTFYIVNGGGGSKIDDYIMRRISKKWITWIHSRSTENGLYLKDKYTERYHIYGEISWGFMDIKVDKNILSTSYYRWLDVDTFFKITEQATDSWEMIPVQPKPYKFVHRLTKTRYFTD